ncbi:hypothetical protein RJZ56_005923 [Blastomyces dermatitidis]|uniref:Uncharacterized protein n=1 Tax=Ajellomyces dermatitidis (strain ATCC 18188 / CBS 674.68) TaxID=653446 RepID=F2TCI5_AJEDA|nr:hypothetical protein BDDG_03889 [Blastomyces dermatitidis ATCC 18188]KMW67410.1 hypothetical protein, variant 1 [Blastomyces dermatitidis ATCC 18188]
MVRNSPSAGNNDASDNHHDLIPGPHDKYTANNKAPLANDTRSPPPQIDPTALKAEDISNSTVSASTQASSASEPVLHLRGGGAIASVIVPDPYPDDDQRPSRVLWYVSTGTGRRPTFGEIRRARTMQRSNSDGRSSYGGHVPESENMPQYAPPKERGRGFCKTIGYILTCGRCFQRRGQEPEWEPPDELVPAFYPPRP